MQEYVLVLPVSFQGTSEDVLLVLKNKPAWMAGRLNLLGGKIEEGETPQEACIRELKEESGFRCCRPVLHGKIIGDNSVIYCFSCDLIGAGEVKPREGETEKVDWYNWYEIKDDPRLIPNLRVIVPLLYQEISGWTITDQKSSFGSSKHEITVTLDI